MRTKVVLVLLMAVCLAGCGGKNAKELLETAQFEEKQHNLEHARKLYEELVAKYPSTQQGELAKKRLEELKKGQ